MRHITNHETPRFWETTRCNSTLELLRGIVFLVKFHHLAMEKCCVATRLADMIPATLEPATLDMWTLELCLSDGMSSSRMADVEEHDRDTLAASCGRKAICGISRVFKSRTQTFALQEWIDQTMPHCEVQRLVSLAPLSDSSEDLECVCVCVDMIGLWGSSSFDTHLQIHKPILRHWWLNKKPYQLLQATKISADPPKKWPHKINKKLHLLTVFQTFPSEIQGFACHLSLDQLGIPTVHCQSPNVRDVAGSRRGARPWTLEIRNGQSLFDVNIMQIKKWLDLVFSDQKTTFQETSFQIV